MENFQFIEVLDGDVINSSRHLFWTAAAAAPAPAVLSFVRHNCCPNVRWRTENNVKNVWPLQRVLSCWGRGSVGLSRTSQKLPGAHTLGKYTKGGNQHLIWIEFITWFKIVGCFFPVFFVCQQRNNFDQKMTRNHAANAWSRTNFTLLYYTNGRVPLQLPPASCVQNFRAAGQRDPVHPSRFSLFWPILKLPEKGVESRGPTLLLHNSVLYPHKHGSTPTSRGSCRCTTKLN